MFMNRTQRKESRLLLNKLLKIELEQLRKIFIPYKRRALLINKVTIEIKSGEKYVLGYYENDKKTNRQFKYTHKIYITEYHLKGYYNYCKLSMKRNALLELRDTIRHELIHAFIYEQFDDWEFESIKNCNSDYSPIFLSCLYWCGGRTGHKYTDKFLDSELYLRIKELKKYDQVQTILLTYMFEFEKILRDININQDEHSPKQLDIVFNNNGAGFKKRNYIKAYVKSKDKGKFKRGTTEIMTLGIGFLVTPTKLLENYKRIFTNGVIANSHIEEVIYVNKEKGEFKNPIIIFEK